MRLQTPNKNRKHARRCSRLITLLSGLALLSAGETAFAQCDALTMPNYIAGCPGDVLSMPATLTGANALLGITWTPAAGLSSASVLNPSLTVPGTSGWYYITVQTALPGNLVTNGDFSAGNTGFTSAYTFVTNTSTSLEPAGVYAIVANPHDDHPLAASFGDHTTGTGLMMAINGASSPVSVWSETITVSAYTSYAFSAWFSNWSSNTTTNLPLLQFRVNGAPLGSGSFSIPGTQGLWSQYYATWNSGSFSGPLTIDIFDSQTAADGNDFAIDDISFSQLCTLTDSIYVDATCPPNCNNVQMPDSLTLCIGDSAVMPATIGGPDSVLNITWTPATGLSSATVLDPTLTASTSGWYDLTVQSLIPGNLVANGDFSAGNTGFGSAYTYVPNSSMALWPAGVYAIVTNPHLDHPYAASFGDHTTSTGNMMAINGASTPVDVWCSTVIVAPNTNYAFSAWFANWSSDTTTNLPQIIFRINGVLMSSSPFTFPPTYGVWTQFYTIWNSGTLSGPISICIYDQQTAAVGNDFAIDDISFQRVCTTKDSIYVNAQKCRHQCADSSSITYTSTTDKKGNCIITATANVSSVYYILGYRWSGAGASVTDINHTGTDSYTFTLAPGASVNLSCLVYIVDTALGDSTGPCCQVQLNQQITCQGNQQQPCIDSAQSSIIYADSTAADGGCIFNCTANAVPLPPYVITGYLWSVNGGAAVPGGATFTTPEAAPGTTTTVTVTVMANSPNGGPCTFTMTITIFCQGNKNQNRQANPNGNSTGANQIMVYPNPTDNNVTVYASQGINTIEVIDVNGNKLVASAPNGASSQTISLAKFAPGTYLFRINGTVSQVVSKVN